MSKDIRTTLVVDRGPVWDAAATLVSESTLRDHVTLSHSDGTLAIHQDPDGVPFDMWGSGTQGLWRLLSAIAYTSETVSLYEVISRLDRRNTRAVAHAINALCEES